MASTKQRLEVFSIREAKVKGEQSSFWTRCGVGFVNKDGSINVKLDLIPIDGKLHIREPKPKTEKQDEAAPSSDFAE